MLDASDGPSLQVFAAVVQHGSFSAAAGALKLSKSAVSQRVQLLEARCGARLLERTTRKLRLTAEGAQVLAVATQIGDTLGHLTRTLDAARREPSGTLRVSTTNDLGPLLVAPVTARFVQAYPKVRAEILAEDASRDVLEARVDVAVRLGVPKSTSFVVRKLAAIDEPIVAAPRLAAGLARASAPRELAGARWVRHALVSGSTLRFRGPHGATQEVTLDVAAEANSGATLLALLLHGAGIGVFPEHALREHLRAGRLVRLCPGWLWKTVTLYALTPSKAANRPALQAFLTMLKEQVALDAGRFTGPGTGRAA